MQQKIYIGLAGLLFGLSPFSTSAQQTLNVSGKHAVIEGMHFDYSIGEMVLVHTARPGSLLVTQGMLQPQVTDATGGGAASDGNLSSWADQVKVFPNPTQSILFVECHQEIATEVSLTVFDGTGKIVSAQTELAKVGSNRFSLDLQALAAGTYYLVCRQLSNGSADAPLSFKIQKIQ